MKNIVSLLVSLSVLLIQSSSFATTGFQCYDAKTSGKRESHYLIFARLDYFQKNLPISSADIKVDGKWHSISDRGVKKFKRSKNKLNAHIVVSKAKAVQLHLESADRLGTASGTFTVYSAEKTNKGSISSSTTTQIKCLLDDTL